MQVQYVPLLARQREIYELPRGMARFRTYLSTMVNEQSGDVTVFPLVAMNPMGKDHCADLLDQYLALDAESIAQAELDTLLPILPRTEATLKFSLVLVDDAKGGWTNRIDCEYRARTTTAATLRRYPWVTGALWTSAAPSEDYIRQTTRLAISRAACTLVNGDPCTLQEILVQEGQVQHLANLPPEPLLPEEIEYTQAVLEPYLHTDGMPTIIAALFGDEGASALGYKPLGLEKDAGLRLAWHEF